MKKNKGITLVALVVTIVIMLILVGVTLNMALGDNGLFKTAEKTVDEYGEASRIEQLQMMLLNRTLNFDVDDTLDSFLKSRVKEEIENAFKMDVDKNGKLKNVVEKDGYYYSIEEDENGNYVIERLTDEQMGDKMTVLTKDNFNDNGELTFDPKKDNLESETVVFGDKVEREQFCFDIRSGEVTIYIDYDMYLTNKDVKPARSAINIEPNAKLTLYIAKGVTLTVDSGYGTVGATGNMGELKQNQGGSGGFAGIRVPKTEDGAAALDIKGEGTVIAFGGNATAGGAGTSDLSTQSEGGNGGGRRRSVLEQVSVGNGGKGGESNSVMYMPYKDLSKININNSGHDGYHGEDCGIVNILRYR